MDLDQIKKLDIPKAPGSYQFKDKDGAIIYVGKAANLRNRVVSYWQKGTNHPPAKKHMMAEIASVEWIETDTEIEAYLLEANLIKKYRPHFNILLRDDKRFAYIKVSTEDEIPGVFVTRKIDRAGKYFGPFTSGLAVRETLKAVRKIWPYCTERRLGNKPCFYYQIGRCLGPCGAKVSIDEYKKEVIEPIIKFLSGRKKEIIRQLEKDIKLLERQSKHGRGTELAASGEAEEKLPFLKYKLLNMNNVLEHANILGVSEKYAADVVELAKILSLPVVPKRIEGYDISNIFGQEAVGSMVVFNDGEPNRSEYRKFKIRIGQGEANDVGMLREVLERRFKRSTTPSPDHHMDTVNEEGRSDEAEKQISTGVIVRKSKIENRKLESWPLPDLVVIDGGKGQLNGALKEIKKAGLDIPAIAVSKGAGLRSAAAPDKIFFPGEKQPLELPLASPAIHIIKRVRDEAHRFAITYHKLLRKKKMLK